MAENKNVTGDRARMYSDRPGTSNSGTSMGSGVKGLDRGMDREETRDHGNSKEMHDKGFESRNRPGSTDSGSMVNSQTGHSSYGNEPRETGGQPGNTSGSGSGGGRWTQGWERPSGGTTEGSPPDTGNKTGTDTERDRPPRWTEDRNK